MVHILIRLYTFLFLIVICFGCNSQTSKTEVSKAPAQKITAQKQLPVYKNNSDFDTTTKTIHVMVALCDNKYQGIVPVPERIGNGKDPDNNLYWGCGFGIRTYFKSSKEWKLLKKTKLDATRLERLVFKHVSTNYYLVADAYDGQFIQQCTEEFLNSCSGLYKDTIHINNTILGIYGNSSLLSYIGHDGLMDFSLFDTFENTDNRQRPCIILACYSKYFFGPYLKATKAIPLVWTNGLMCPEAYTLHDALTGFVNRESNESIRSRAAMAYSKYQKCSIKAARNLLLTGK